MNKKSIVRRGVSEDELNRFLDLFPEESRDEVIELMSNKHVAAIQLIIAAKENTGDYYKSRMIVTDTRTRLGVLSSLGFGQKVAYFNEEDKAFILSFISRCFAAFKLIFSSSRMAVFVAKADNMSATILAPYVLKDHLFIRILSNGNDIAMLNLSQNNAEVSDDIWNIILSDRDNVKHILRGYISKRYYFSDNTKNDIKKRLHALYDSLPYSKKLSVVDESKKGAD